MSALTAPPPSKSEEPAAVAVLGLGLMGSAIARSFLTRGSRVSVWNRTAARCLPLAADGAANSPSPLSAVQSADLVVLALLDYKAARAVLAEAAEALSGKTVVNLVTGTPTDADDLDTWVRGQGARYLEGIIAAYPDDIGKPETLIYYSGDAGAWTDHRGELVALAGAATFVGAAPGAANVMDAAMTAAFYDVSIGAFIEGVSFARSAGVDLAEIKRTLGYWLDLLKGELIVALDDIAGDDYSTDQATLETYLLGMRTCRQAMVDAGERAHLLSAALDNLDRANEAGHGNQSLAAQFNVTRITKQNGS